MIRGGSQRNAHARQPHRDAQIHIQAGLGQKQHRMLPQSRLNLDHAARIEQDHGRRRGRGEGWEMGMTFREGRIVDGDVVRAAGLVT